MDNRDDEPDAAMRRWIWKYRATFWIGVVAGLALCFYFLRNA